MISPSRSGSRERSGTTARQDDAGSIDCPARYIRGGFLAASGVGMGFSVALSNPGAAPGATGRHTLDI
jgi:hypothetical protein